MLETTLTWSVLTTKLSLILTAAFLGHQYLVLPIEASITDPGLALIASAIFFPHGVKALIATLAGYHSILPIAIAQFIGGLFYDLTVSQAFVAALIGTTAVIIPLLIIRTIRTSWRSHSGLNLFWLMLFIGAASSVLNSFLISFYHGYEIAGAISLRFLTGDLLGVIAIFGTVVAFRRVLAKHAIKQVRKTLENR